VQDMRASVLEPISEQQKAEGLVPPEIVRSESVDVQYGAKIVTVGNAAGHYTLCCNTEAEHCLTPTPGKDYLLFTKTTHWRYPGAENPVNLAFFQDWSVTYTKQENIAIVPRESDRFHFGMYWLKSWKERQ